MKWFLLCYCALAFSLQGCQYLGFFQEEEAWHPSPKIIEREASEFKRTVKYGAKFATEYDEDYDNKIANAICEKYKKQYQEGDWRAGWMLALHVNNTNDKPCVSRKEAILILSTLESEKKIDFELRWVSQYHLRLLQKLQKIKKNIKQLKQTARRNKQQSASLEKQNNEVIDALKKQNQEQFEKLEALKAIETNINH